MNNLSREEALFNEALGLPAARQGRFLEEACPDDPALRERVVALLREHGHGGGALDAPPHLSTNDVAHLLQNPAPAEDVAGAKIGRYKLLQKLGEGGCGVVFMAQQEEPVRRRVAVKVIKLGMDTKEVVARFDAERQALAMMDHPNIASVLDAGATESGRPFFVMELVRGVPITKYCDEQNLSTAERLKLFTQVCHAVQHAHQKGIIHRDLKPSNILVTLHDGIPVPKVIDFGIAKATQGRLTDATVFTAFEQFIGTPAYMSPEQAELSGLDIDTRSDVYSLGVLLYELLTGRLPFDPKSLVAVGLDEIRRIIREVEPPRPSIRLSTLGLPDRATIAKQRATLPELLSPLIRGDLDWIVMRCLEKDRARRYETANSLALDISRHLENEPVAARPPSTAYVLHKFIRRNKLAFAAAGGIVGALVLGLVFAMWGLQRERAAREHADRAATRSEQVARFMKDMLAGVGPQIALGRDTKLLRAILDETSERLPRELKDQPEVEADLRESLGNVYRDIGEYRSGTLMHETALQMRRKAFGPEHPAVASSLGNLGELLLRQDKLAEAEVILRQALAMREKLLGNDHPATAASRAALGHVLLRKAQSGKADEAHGVPAATMMGKPAVIRIAQTGGRVSGQPYGSGDVLRTALQHGVLEREFATDGIRIQWTVYPNAVATNEASARGLVDFAGQGDIMAIVGRGKGLQHRALLVLKRFGETQHLVVRADSPFHSLADLKGKRFATIEGGHAQMMLYRFFEKHGLTAKDFVVVYRESGAAIRNALVAGELDGQLMAVPFDLETAGELRVIESFDSPRDDPRAQVFWVTDDFERRYPTLVQRMVNALIKTAAWNSDENNRAAVFELWSKPDHSAAALEKSWGSLPLKERLSPLMDDYFLAAVRRSLDEARHFGMISGEVSLSDWVEPKYLQIGLGELKLQDFWARLDESGQPVKQR